MRYDVNISILFTEVPLLARPSKLELLLEIMDYPLPQRKPA